MGKRARGWRDKKRWRWPRSGKRQARGRRRRRGPDLAAVLVKQVLRQLVQEEAQGTGAETSQPRSRGARGGVLLDMEPRLTPTMRGTERFQEDESRSSLIHSSGISL